MPARGRIELDERSERIRVRVLARAERRFRGLTATERDLLDWTTLQLVSELLSAGCQQHAALSGSDTANSRPDRHGGPSTGGRLG
jgi:hypothetical protein